MYIFVKKNEGNYVIKNKWLKFITVGEIILSVVDIEIKVSTTMSIYNQVELFNEIVEKFEEVKNKQVKFTNFKTKEIQNDNYCIGEIC